ncbi:MAG: ABC transporter ATP-binding protein [Planctomycetota bacterium]
MIQSSLPTPIPDLDGEVIFKLLSRLGMRFDLRVEHADIVDTEIPNPEDENISHGLLRLVQSGTRAGIDLKPVDLKEVDEARAFVNENYPLVVIQTDGTLTLVDSFAGGRWMATRIDQEATDRSLGRLGIRELLWGDPGSVVLVAKQALDLDAISSSPYHSQSHHDHEHLSPFKRFVGLLRLEVRDIWTMVLFAFVAGILTLATPLAVESLVNVVSWGTYIQPLIVLGLILFTCLGIAGVLRILQMWLVELIQRRQFVRIVSDLAHRFPRVQQSAMEGQYPRELANRVFDIMTIQKATAVLLFDGVSIVLTTVLGLVLLGFYHPFLLGFDILLVASMVSITWVLGRGGVRTAIEESITKYRVAHWLQDVIASPSAFKTGGGEGLAIQRANQLTSDYVNARKRQFNVVIRQSAFAITVQVVASSGLLALGGWLVIDGLLTLGQLVASELVVTVVVGAFAKAGKSLEKFYDLMAGVDKVGHLIDRPAERSQFGGFLPTMPVSVRWSDLVFQRVTGSTAVREFQIPPGSQVAIVGDDVDGRSDLARSIAGVIRPTSGNIQVGDEEAAEAASSSFALIGYAGEKHVFHGTIFENIDLGRSRVSAQRVREVLGQVGLEDVVMKLPEGIQTNLQTDGYPLTASQVTMLSIARAMAAEPKLLVIDGLLDSLPEETRNTLWSALSAPDAPWTLVVTSNHSQIAELCGTQINLRKMVEV